MPGVIGSNIFRDVRQELSRNGGRLLIEAGGIWGTCLGTRTRLYSEIRVDRSDVSGRVRVAGKKPQLVGVKRVKRDTRVILEIAICKE